MNANETARALKNIEAEIEALQEKRQEIRRSCTHRFEDGSKSTYPVGGGDSMCSICRIQLD